MDALSDVLRAVRLSGAIFFDIRASEPWLAETPAGPSIVGRMFPGAEHLICYHVMIEGSCWGTVRDRPPVRLETGDVIMVPHGDAHVIGSAPGLRGVAEVDRYRHPDEGQLPFKLSMGMPGGAPARFICGFLGCDARPFNPLLAALPSVIHVGEGTGGSLAALVQLAAEESKKARPGGEVVLGHLSELMFVDVVRRYIESLPADSTGWLSGLRDPFIGRALTALHRNPSQAWTLESLAHEVGLSRSVLAERFTKFVGQPAMQYLTNWRMQLAARLLTGSLDSVAEIAAKVGYESEAAFSRAFKKAVGEPPGQWRKGKSGSG
jgi:AraC-like DNA-binding protein